MELVAYNGGGGSNSSGQTQNDRLPPLPGQIKKASDYENKYSLANSNILHSLPPRNSLKPNIEYQPGMIDTWPAHSANQRPANMQLSLNKYGSLVVSDCQAEGKPDLTPKPKFLENLEKFLHRELKALGCFNTLDNTTSESRLQAYREVFEYLLEEFKTYKPLLSSIKNEYEMMLAYQREKIRELEPLKQMLVTLADQCDHKLMQYREEEKIEIKKLKEEKKYLMDMIAQLKNDKQSLQVQVDKLQNELIAEHERFRNEQDKKKLLILDLNDLRFQQEEAKLAEMKREKKVNADGTPIEEEPTNEDDPVTLKIGLRVCRQNLTDAMKRLTKMEADYNDVMPKRDFVALENNFKQLSSLNETLEKDFKTLKQENTNAKDNIKQLESKISELTQELEATRGNYTPRPDWERCATLVDDGSDKWKELASNKTSIQLLDTLLQEFSKNSSVPENFIGLGLSAEVPFHLRYEGKLKNLNLNKKDSIALIVETLKERMQQRSNPDESGDESLCEFLINFLKKRHGNEAYEYTYSLNQAFDKYPNNELIQYFAGVLYGQADEELYFFEQKIIMGLYEFLKTKELTGELFLKHSFRDLLKSIFVRKNSEQIDTLMKLAEDELDTSDSSKIEFKNLFVEESDGKCGQFLILFKNYLKEVKQNLIKQILDAMGNINSISPAEFKRVLVATAEDSISESNLNKIINWVFDRENKQIDMETLKKKLENGCLFNYPKVLNIV